MQSAYPDYFRFEAAHGWLMLGCPDQAEVELAGLHPGSRSHARFFGLCCRVLLARRRFASALRAAHAQLVRAPDEPEAWIHRAYCLHELRRTGEALEGLRPAARRFPGHRLIAFNLACYCCHLRRFREARFWVKRSLALGGPD